MQAVCGRQSQSKSKSLYIKFNQFLLKMLSSTSTSTSTSHHLKYNPNHDSHLKGRRRGTGTGGFPYICPSTRTHTVHVPVPMPMLMPNSRVTFTLVDGLDDGSWIWIEEVYDHIFGFVDFYPTTPKPLPCWLWLITQLCRSYYDIRLLFIILQVHYDVESTYLDTLLSEEITKTCIRFGALEYAKLGLCPSNHCSLMPSIESAHHLLNYAKDHNDLRLMAETFNLIIMNKLPLQPDTAEIIFRTCYNADNWRLLSSYSKKFISAEVKLHHTSYEMLMEFASKIGDFDSVRKFERLRSQITLLHTCRSGFSYAKSLLVQYSYGKAGEVILDLLRQFLPAVNDPCFRKLLPDEYSDSDWPDDLLSEFRTGGLNQWPQEIMIEIQKLVKEWPSQLLHYQKEAKKREEYAAILKRCIPKMVDYLSTNGYELKLSLKHLNQLGK